MVLSSFADIVIISGLAGGGILIHPIAWHLIAFLLVAAILFARILDAVKRAIFWTYP